VLNRLGAGHTYPGTYKLVIGGIDGRQEGSERRSVLSRAILCTGVTPPPGDTETSCMSARLLKWLGGVGFAVVIAAELMGNIYITGLDARLQAEVAQARLRAAAYSRPVISGEPLDENAADWYRRAFSGKAELQRGTLHAVDQAADAGAGGDADARQALLNGPCRRIDRPPLRDALRCTHCDWKLPYDVIQSSAEDFSIRPRVAAQCMVLEGHQLASSGDLRGAMRSYLETVAIGCDFGVGDLVTNLQGHAITQTGLMAIARLAATTDDAALLGEMSGQLAAFEDSLPLADASVTFERLRLLTAASKLERTKSWALAAWRLSHDDRLLNDIAKAEHVSGGPSGFVLHEKMERRVAVARSPVIRQSRADQWILFIMDAEIIRQMYGAVQTAIALEKLHVTAGDFPRDPTSIQSMLNTYGLTYRRTAIGYQLIAPRNREAHAVILEQPAPEKASR